MNNLIIDVYTKDGKKILNTLKKLKSTEEIGLYQYRWCPECSQIKIKTKLTEDQMDRLLYDRKDIPNYIGVVEDKNEQKHC